MRENRVGFCFTEVQVSLRVLKWHKGTENGRRGMKWLFLHLIDKLGRALQVQGTGKMVP
jgi:hypothetical protein